MKKDYIAMFLNDNGLEYGQWFKIRQYQETELEFMIETSGRLKCSSTTYFSSEGLDNLLRDLLIGVETVITLGETLARTVGATLNVAYDVCEVNGAAVATKGRIVFKKGKEPIEFVSYVSDKEYSVYTALGELLLGKVVLK